jgi:1,4-dihydroxy-2-naphthoate octaprenyltransferase
MKEFQLPEAKSSWLTWSRAFIQLARLKMTVFSMVTYAAGSLLGFKLIRNIIPSALFQSDLYWTGLAFVLCCQLTAHFLGEYYDLPSDKENTFSSPLTGGSKVLSGKVLIINPRDSWVVGSLTCISAVLILMCALPSHELSGIAALGSLMIFVAHQYSSPPFQLNHRGLGEVMAAVIMNVILPYFAIRLQTGQTVNWSFILKQGSLLVIPAAFFKFSLFVVLNWADRRADFLGQKWTLPLTIGLQYAALSHQLAIFFGYISVVPIVWWVPELQFHGLVLYASLCFVLPKVRALFFALGPHALEISPELVHTALLFAPIPVATLFAVIWLQSIPYLPLFTAVSISVPLIPYLRMLKGKRAVPGVPVEQFILSNFESRSPVVIVGGGIAGLVSAIHLKQANIPVVVLEKRGSDEAESGADLGLWPSALKDLKQLIADDKFWEQNSVPIQRVEISQVRPNLNGELRITGHLRSINMRNILKTSKDEFRLVARRPLISKLRELISGNIQYNTQVINLREVESGVEIVCKSSTCGQQTMRARFVIGADGVQSVVRRFLNPLEPKSPRLSGETCYRGVVDLSHPNDHALLSLNRFSGESINTMPLWYGIGFRASFGYIGETKQMGYWWVKIPSELNPNVSHWPSPLRELYDATPPENVYVQYVLNCLSFDKCQP